MRKLINLSAFVLAILIIVFMLIPTKTVDRNASVYVEHEWDTLENVILGSPKMLAVPQIHKSVLGYGYIVKNEKIMKEAPGKPIQQVNPFVFSNILTESDTVAKILKDILNPDEVPDNAKLITLSTCVDGGKKISTPEYSQTVVNEGPKVGRNDPCPCGSGKKYKNCCGRNA